MIRMTRLTDYAVVLLTHIARAEETELQNARDLATASRLPLPTVNKILKTLTRKGLLRSQRGAKGGYRLARGAENVSMADIVAATEGPLSITACSTEDSGSCEHEGLCPVGSNWQRINDAIREALAGVTLAEMTRPFPPGAKILPLRRPGEGARASCGSGR